MKARRQQFLCLILQVHAAMARHTCCIPVCDSSSRKVREKSVVVKNIRRKLSFKPTAHSHVCSAHFIGGAKDKKDTNFIFMESKRSATIQR